MRLSALALIAALGCWGDKAYIVEGTVLEVEPGEIVVQHEAIPGLMGAMTMPFEVRDAEQLEGLRPGDRIYARLMLEPEGSYLARIRVTGHEELPENAVELPTGSLRPGRALPGLKLPLARGGERVLGKGQPRPVALGFLYTTCPMPEFCPATVARLQGLQPRIEGVADIVTITLDPEHDTAEVLQRYAESIGANPEVWQLGRLPPEQLMELAAHAGLPIREEGEEIVHAVRLLVLDAEGRLIERYDDNRWPLERVVQQLKTGEPSAPPGSSGTATPRSPASPPR